MTTKCAYGLVNREKILALEKKMENVDGKLDKIINKNEEMFNHFTERYEAMFEKLRSRVPGWMTIASTILGSMVTGLIVYVVAV